MKNPIIIPPELLVSTTRKLDSVEAILDRLIPRQNEVIRLYYGLGTPWDHWPRRSDREVGKIVGLSASRVNVIRNETLRRIRRLEPLCTPELLECWFNVNTAFNCRHVDALYHDVYG